MIAFSYREMETEVEEFSEERRAIHWGRIGGYRGLIAKNRDK